MRRKLSAAMPLAAVRLRSCVRHGLNLSPRIFRIRPSRLVFAFEKPLTGVRPVVEKMNSSLFMSSRSSRRTASECRSTVCVLPFFTVHLMREFSSLSAVGSGAKTHMAASRSSSRHLMAATSFRRCPVSKSSLRWFRKASLAGWRPATTPRFPHQREHGREL